MVELNLALADLNARVTHANAAPAIPPIYNGSLGRVDIAKPVDYTDDWGKVHIDAGRYCLAGTIRYYLWLAQDKPVAQTALTQDHLNKSLKWVARAIAKDRILTIMHHSGIVQVHRANDMAPAVSDAIISDRLVNELYGLLTADEVMDALVAIEGRYVLFAFVACAAHRAMFNDHSWFTREMRNPKSLTYKLCAIAAEDKDSFASWMRECGHDILHHIASGALENMAMALVGKEEPHASFAAAPPAAGGGAGHALAALSDARWNRRPRYACL